MTRGIPFTAGDGFFGRHGSRSVDSKPSRRAVRRTQAWSGEWPAAPDARPQPLKFFRGRHGIDHLHPSGRPGEEAIGPVAHASASTPAQVVSLSNGVAAGTRPLPVLEHAPPSWPVMCQWLLIRQYARMRILCILVISSRVLFFRIYSDFVFRISAYRAAA
jgi:hypothetical protein